MGRKVISMSYSSAILRVSDAPGFISDFFFFYDTLTQVEGCVGRYTVAIDRLIYLFRKYLLSTS